MTRGLEQEAEQNRSSNVEAALAYARRGWRVIPCHTPMSINGQPGCSCPRGLSCTSPGKHPRTHDGVKSATTDESTVREWWARWPDAGIGLATGSASGIVVLDVDPRHGGDASLAELEAELGTLPPTVVVETGGDGQHVYFAAPEVPVRNSVGRLGDGLDVRGDDGYVIAPPSAHASGKAYAFADGCGPDDVPLATLPEVLLERITAPRMSPATTSHAQDGAVREGSRNATLASIAGTMRKRGMSAAAIEAALLIENRDRCAPPLPDAEVRNIAASIARYTPGDSAHVANVIGDELPVAVRELLGEHKRLQTLFEGTGKPEFGEDGQRFDATPEGHDKSFAQRLVKLGVTAVSELATAVACRPDGHARAKGEAYILGIVRAPLGSAAAPALNGSSTAGVPNHGPHTTAWAASVLSVQHVRFYTSDPARYELEIGGDTVSFTSRQLLELASFRLRYFERTRTIPCLPVGKDAAAKWERIVEDLAQAAEVIELPGDATTDGALRDAVERAVRDLQIGEDVSALDEGRAFASGGKILFKTAAVKRQVHASYEKAKPEDIGRHLVALGLECKTRRVGTTTVKAWATELPVAYLAPPATTSPTLAPSAPAAEIAPVPPALPPPSAPLSESPADEDLSPAPVTGPAPFSDHADFSFEAA